MGVFNDQQDRAQHGHCFYQRHQRGQSFFFNCSELSSVSGGNGVSDDDKSDAI